ncbi:tripartite motif-containing protein 10-like [Sceloporus undulatus]|uniref:tripartite motif-containing protein 10-like n=1 Tax=Sceloporus undulatus TaxID=8520 RepID=UPI001C4CB688|nr:tripartite motif-containing protein 10-like [Sceloporus undulatus]
MELGGPIWGLCHETTCPFCQDYFKDPVTTDCGHNFCQVCIAQYYGESGRHTYCPQCKEIIWPWNFRSNWKLANIVEITKKLQEQKLAEGKWGLCEKHLDPLKLFCNDDESPICVVCDKSKDHRDHNVCPIEEISQEYKEEIKEHLKSLKNERKKLEDMQLGIEQRVQEYLTELEIKKQKVISTFEGIQMFLDLKKHFWLNQLENLEMEIKRREEEKLTQLSEENLQLSQVITEMEGMCQQPTSDFLQNIRNVLSRHKKNSEGHMVDHFPTLEERLRIYAQKISDLKKALMDSQDTMEQAMNTIDLDQTINIGLTETSKEVPTEPEVIVVPIPEPELEMPVTVPSEPRIEQTMETKDMVSVTLHPDTAHSQLSLSKELKHLTTPARKQSVPKNPTRLDPARCVMGEKTITSGRYYWEVEVVNKQSSMSLVGEPEWAVGVTSNSLERKGNLSFNPIEGVWAVGKPFSHVYSPCQVWAFKYPRWTPVTMRQEPKKIRVALDYEEGRVEFFDAETDDSIFAFHLGTFSGKGIQPFFHTGMWGVSLKY